MSAELHLVSRAYVSRLIDRRGSFRQSVPVPLPQVKQWSWEVQLVGRLRQLVFAKHLQRPSFTARGEPRRFVVRGRRNCLSMRYLSAQAIGRGDCSAFGRSLPALLSPERICSDDGLLFVLCVMPGIAVIGMQGILRLPQ